MDIKYTVTTKKWIHVVDFNCWGVRRGKFAFNYIIVELFDRKLHPRYPEDADEQMRKVITWQAAHDDIAQQKAKGIMGPMFLITCPLYYKNKGKKKREELPYWSEEYGGFNYTGKVSNTTVVRMWDMEPDWVYRATGCRKIDDSGLQYIKKNYSMIEERILKEKHVERATGSVLRCKLKNRILIHRRNHHKIQVVISLHFKGFKNFTY